MNCGYNATGLSRATKNALALAVRPDVGIASLDTWQRKVLDNAGFITGHRLNDAGRAAWERLSRGEKVTA